MVICHYILIAKRFPRILNVVMLGVKEGIGWWVPFMGV